MDLKNKDLVEVVQVRFDKRVVLVQNHPVILPGGY